VAAVPCNAELLSARTSASSWGWLTQGISISELREPVDPPGPAPVEARPAFTAPASLPRSATTPPPERLPLPKTNREQQLLREIHNRPSVHDWRTYGDCQYLWNDWKLQKNGVRVTRSRCGTNNALEHILRPYTYVDCRLLLHSQGIFSPEPLLSRKPSELWNEPAGAKAEMVARLCSQVRR
jgi:hypothetical protein